MEGMRALLLGLVAVIVACGKERADEYANVPRPRTPGVRMSMHELHMQGGVPRSWRLTPPPGDVAAGRAAFVEFGCHSCHRVDGESFSVKPGSGEVGPDLTGMGAHHPPAYFVEAIVAPDAILIEGPGYIGPDGHSTMPDYPDMTIRQLGDVVAYVSSLKTGGAHAGHVMTAPTGLSMESSLRPMPPSADAKAYLIQSYDVKADQLRAFEDWWKAEGAQRFLAYDGLVSVDTYVDFTRSERLYTSIFGFRDQSRLQAFSQDAKTEELGLAFDRYIGDHDHLYQLWTPIYRVPSLSAP
jgi:mono/diheme cytochrome c family protein